MNRSYRPFTRRSQDGAVAVEAAVCIALVLVPLIYFVFLFGRFFWHYSVVNKAIHDAALYMAKAPIDEVRSGAAKGLANYIIRQETADLDSTTRLESEVQCGYRASATSKILRFMSCERSNAPYAVQVNTFMTVTNPFPSASGGSSDFQFLLTATMPHVIK